jgi:hypothetical protein
MQHNLTHFELPHGPRRKSLATIHAEYIAHSILENANEVQYNAHGHMLINGRQFNLKTLMSAQPDLEQIQFTDYQLDRFVTLIQAHNHSPYRSLSNSHLHIAEKTVINNWTGGWYSRINNFLRNHIIEQQSQFHSLYVFLQACILGSALSKPYSRPVGSIQSTRGEGSVADVNAKRNEAINNKTVFLNAGFIASSLGGRGFSGGTKITYKQPGDSFNPMGKNIAKMSQYEREKEVLFPHGTEFIFEPNPQNKQHYLATPVRTISREGSHFETAYAASFTNQDLQEINQSHLKTKLKLLLKHLIKNQQQLKHCGVRRLFDTVSNELKNACIVNVVNAIQAQLLSGNINLSELKLMCDSQISQNAYLVHTSRLPSSLGKTHQILLLALNEVKQIEGDLNYANKSFAGVVDSEEPAADHHLPQGFSLIY